MMRKIITITMLMLYFSVSQALAISPQDLQNLYDGNLYYWGDQSQSTTACGAGAPTATSTPVATTQTQTQNAQIIMGIAKTDNISESGALIGLMVGSDESSLTNDANKNVPLSEQNPAKQGDGSEGTSLGIFQQQITENWSTISSDINNVDAINQLMTPAYAAEAFFGGSNGSLPALSKGLLNTAGWQSMQPWVAAQSVQVSAFNGIPSTANGESSVVGGNYEKFIAQAQSLLNQYWSSATAVALPVPLTGGLSSNAGSGYTGSSCGSTSSTTPGTYMNPLRDVSGLTPERIDQGVDYAGSGSVYAIGDGVVDNLVNSGWNFGGYDAFLSYQLSDGPAKGLYVYVAEDCIPQVTIGEQVTSSTALCNINNPSGSGIETGWAEAPGDGLAIASGEFNGSNSTAYGINFNKLLMSLGAPSGALQNSGPPGSLPSNWPQW